MEQHLDLGEGIATFMKKCLQKYFLQGLGEKK